MFGEFESNLTSSGCLVNFTSFLLTMPLPPLAVNYDSCSPKNIYVQYVP